MRKCSSSKMNNILSKLIFKNVLKRIIQIQGTMKVGIL